MYDVCGRAGGTAHVHQTASLSKLQQRRSRENTLEEPFSRTKSELVLSIYEVGYIFLIERERERVR